MEMEAEIRVMLPQAKGCQQPAEAGGGEEWTPWSLQRGCSPADPLILAFWPLELRQARFNLVLSPPICGN